MRNTLPCLLLILCASLLLAETGPADFLFEPQQVPENPAVALLNKAMRAVEDNLFDAAMQHYADYIEIVRPEEPEFANGTIQYVRICIKLNRIQQAEDALQAHSAGSKGTVSQELQDQLDLLSAQIARQKNDDDTLLAKTTPILSRENTTMEIRKEVLTLTADTFAKQKKWPEFLKLMQEFNAKFPEANHDIEILRRTVQAYSASNLFADAEKILAENLPHLTGAGELIGSLLQIQNYAQIGKFTEAGELYQKILPSLPEQYDREWWYTLNVYGDAAFKAKRWDGALAIYAAAEQIAPDSDSMRILLAQQMKIFLQKEDIRQAQKARARLAEKFRDSTEFLDLTEALARLCRKNDKNQAAELFREITTLKAASPQRLYEATMNCAECLFELGEMEKAKNTFLQARDKGTDDTQRAAALLRAAQANAEIYQDSKITAEAGKTIALYQNIIQNYPNAPQTSVATFQIALLYMELKHYPDAASAFAAFLKNFPDNPRCEEAELQRCIALRKGTSAAEQLLIVADDLEKLALAAKTEDIRNRAPLEAFLAAAKANDFPRADGILTKLIDNPEAPQREDALFQRAILRFVNQDIPKAREDAALFFQDYSSSPLTGELHIHLADSFTSGLDWENALRHYLLAAQSNDAPPQVKTRAYFECAWASSQLNRPKEALDYLERMPGFKSQEEITEPAIKKIVARAYYLKGDILSRLASKPEEFTAAAAAYNSAAQNALAPLLKLSALGRKGEMLFAKAKAFGPVQESQEQQDTLDAAKEVFETLLNDKTLPLRYRIRASFGLANTLLEQKQNDAAKVCLVNIYSDWKGVTALDVKKSLEPIVAQALLSLAALDEQAANDPQSLQNALSYYRCIVDNNLPTKETAKLKIKDLETKISALTAPK